MKRTSNSKFLKSLQFKMIFLSTFGLVLLLLTLLLYVFPVFEKRFIESQKNSIRATVDIAANMIKYYGDRVESKELTLEEAQKQAKNALRAIRYNKSDYFFVYDLQSKSVVHPINKEWEGTDRSNSTDARGVYYIKEMTDLVKASGEGFAEYYATKEKGGPEFPKVSYVKVYKNWDWYVGTGVYVDVMQNSIRDFEATTLMGFAVVVILVCLANFFFARRFSQNIKGILNQVQELSTEVNQTLSELAEAGKSLSSASTTVATSLEETAASLEEISSGIRSNTDSSTQAAKLSKQSEASAEEGKKEIGDLILSMSEISKASGKINEITSMIDDIAFQTNLLALNAAVEAARAGEHGRGFAIVADAVRALALKSASAAKEINVLIQDNASKIEKGTEQADRSGEALEKILESVSRVATLNGEIANASSEQFTGIQQINQAMNEIDRGSQSNAASAVQISSNVVQIARNTEEVEEKVVVLSRLVAG